MLLLEVFVDNVPEQVANFRCWRFIFKPLDMLLLYTYVFSEN